MQYKLHLNSFVKSKNICSGFVCENYGNRQVNWNAADVRALSVRPQTLYCHPVIYRSHVVGTYVSLLAKPVPPLACVC